ncbi:hypothetical protein D3C81_1208500 [compost metagenome]
MQQRGTHVVGKRLGQQHPDVAVQFVDIADGGDAQAVLAGAGAVAQAGGAGVAGAGGNLGQAVAHAGLLLADKRVGGNGALSRRSAGIRHAREGPPAPSFGAGPGAARLCGYRPARRRPRVHEPPRGVECRYSSIRQPGRAPPAFPDHKTGTPPPARPPATSPRRPAGDPHEPPHAARRARPPAPAARLQRSPRGALRRALHHVGWRTRAPWAR